MKKLSFIIVGVLLAVAIVLGLTVHNQLGNAHADSVATPTPPTQEQLQQLQHAAIALKPHIHQDSSGSVSLDVSSGPSVGVDDQTFALFTQAFTQGNTILSKGRSHIITQPKVKTGTANYSSWLDAFLTCMNWPYSQLVNIAGGVFMALGTLAAGVYALLGITLPAWVVAAGIVGAIAFLGVTTWCTGYATGWWLHGLS